VLPAPLRTPCAGVIAFGASLLHELKHIRGVGEDARPARIMPARADATLAVKFTALLGLPECPFRRSGILRCWRLLSRISTALPNL